jgi:hypothetical protein
MAIKEAFALAAAKKAAEIAAQEIYVHTTSAAKASLNRLLVEFGVGFSKYLRRNFDRCRFVKTLLHRVDPIKIESAYVDPSLKIRNKTVSGEDVLAELADLKRVVVTGLGGSGKSMFIKKTFLDLCQKPFGRIPLLVELRDINRTGEDLVDALLKPLSSLIPSFNMAQLEYGLSAGKFVVLLDGLDEVDHTIRDKCSKELLDLTYKYPESLFLITSRPDGRFESWHEFYTAQILPLSKEQVTALVKKIDFDPKTKSRFLNEIGNRLFQTHKTFLSNPLLCTMMLITYSEFEEIPSKMHIFYGRAFDALFSRHDRTKTGFRRKFYTDLAEDDFKRLFSTFCLLSYVESQLSLEEEQAKKYIALAAQHEKLAVSSESFLKDLSQSISILPQDGHLYSFLHRSFQEYFTAIFLSERQTENMGALFERIAAELADAVLPLLFEMNRNAFETKYFAGKIHEWRKELDQINVDQEPQKVLAMIYQDLTIVGGDIRALHHGDWHNTAALLQLYHKELTGIARVTGFHRYWHEFSTVLAKQQETGKGNFAVAKLQVAHVKTSTLFSLANALKDAVVALDTTFQKDKTRDKQFLNTILRGLS